MFFSTETDSVKVNAAKFAPLVIIAVCGSLLGLRALGARRTGGEVAIFEPARDPQAVNVGGAPPQTAVSPTAQTAPATPGAPNTPAGNTEPIQKALSSDEIKRIAEAEQPPEEAPDLMQLVYSPPKLAEYVINGTTKTIAAFYKAFVWILGFSDDGLSNEEKGRAAFNRFLLLCTLGFFALAGGGGYYYWQRIKNAPPAPTIALQAEADTPNPHDMLFDPMNRAYRINLVENGGRQLASLEVLDLLSKTVLDVKELVPGSVLLAQYLPAKKQVEIGLANGLEPVKYLGEWAFEWTSQEVKIYVKNIPAPVAAPPEIHISDAITAQPPAPPPPAPADAEKDPSAAPGTPDLAATAEPTAPGVTSLDPAPAVAAEDEKVEPSGITQMPTLPTPATPAPTENTASNVSGMVVLPPKDDDKKSA